MILVLFVSLRWDKKYDSPYPDLVSSSDSSIIARGQYLVYGLAQCADCHAGIDVYEPGEEIPNM